jgi:hypothetical protein
MLFLHVVDKEVLIQRDLMIDILFQVLPYSRHSDDFDGFNIENNLSTVLFAMFETLTFSSLFLLLFFVLVYGCVVINSNDFKTSLIRTLRDNHQAEFVRHLSTTPTFFHRSEHHHSIYSHNFSKPHNKSWSVLSEINGLKNEDVVMLVTSTSTKGFLFIRERFSLLYCYINTLFTTSLYSE